MTKLWKNGTPYKGDKGLAGLRFEAERCLGGLRIWFSGIIGVSDYSDENIALNSHGGRISIVGERLGVRIYENKSIEISGRIDSIEFKYGKRA